jgi:serine/threonine protein kinase/WD40 repeat protein
MSATSPDVKSIFGRALEIESLAERSAFLNEACTADPALRAEVEDLLRAMEGAGDFMKRPAPAGSVTISHAPILEGPGTRIGPYKLLQQIGEGGMGVVYMAEQETPVRRKVALKIIKPGMDSAQVVARFEAERQALAVMDHTHIARVFDAGTTETGRPYFVMELVHGVPITKYCDDAQLTPRERLELFVPVCQAIQHAHQKGIIHRDIKPSNVLVTMYDDRPVPKVIDFGVAKAIEQRLTERTLFTQFGALVGTFEYMSPEQAEMNAFGVDTRSDIYSLGVLLYELLTGTTPLEKQRLREAALGELVRLIKEEEPPRPSVRLSSSGDLPRIAAARKTEPARLSRLVRGEVDWIVMKCLEKDRTRRYETASGLAKDVEHHLRDEPVEACPPSAGYRLRKFARKNKRWLVTAAVIAAVLLLSAADGLWLLLRATRAEARARVALSQAMQEAAHAAEAQEEALQQRDLATAQRQEAEDARQSPRQSLYDSDMQLAEEAWESGDIFRMRDLLEEDRPQPGMTDLRGFEWHYLRGLDTTVQGARLVQDAGFGQLSPDGLHYVYVGLISLPRMPGPAAGSKIVLRLRDVAAGRPVRSIDPFPGERLSNDNPRLTFSPDGRRFAVTMCVGNAPGRYTWRIKVFDWETGRDVCTLADLGGVPGAAAFDHSGKRLAVVTVREKAQAGSDLKIWDVDGGKRRLAIPLPGWQVVHLQHAVAFSPDGSRIAALTKPVGPEASRSAGEVRAWDAGSGEERLRFETGPASTALAYSPDGKRLVEVASGGASHRLRDAGSGLTILELTSAPSAGKISSVTFSPDGARLAASSADSKVRIWSVTDVETGGGRVPDRILDGKMALLNQVEWSADGRQVCACSESGTVMSWPVTSRDPQVAVRGSGLTDWVAATAAAAGSRFAAAFDAPDGKRVIKVWDEAGHVVFTTNEASAFHDPYPLLHKRAVLSHDGTRLAHYSQEAGGADGTSKIVNRLRVWDVATGREVFHRDVEIADGDMFHAAFSPDGRRLATTWTVPKVSQGKPRRWEYWASIWDLETGRESLHLDLPIATSLAFSPDGRRIAGGLSFAGASPGRRKESEVRVWDAATGKTILTQTFAHGWVAAVTYNGNGAFLAAAVGDAAVGDVGDSEVIKVLDAASGQERLSFAGHRHKIGQLAFSPDGRRLASLAWFPKQVTEVKLWDLAGGREVLTLRPTGVDPVGSNAFANCGFAFSSDGHRLFYLPGGSRRDAEVQVWDATPLPDEWAEVAGRRR